MDYRERVINTVRFQPTDSLLFRHAYGLMPGVFERWHDEGLPASVKTTQELVRHNTPTLTIGRYAHTDEEQKTAAINALPDLRPLDSVAQATGTYESDCPLGCPHPDDQERPTVTQTGEGGVIGTAACDLRKMRTPLQNKGL